MKKLPRTFCWTRMGAEAGQTLDSIIYRKELERASDNGIFIWGIGNSLGDRIWKFVDNIKRPKVLFSEIKSKAKVIDANPDKIYQWTYYRDRYGNCKKLPRHSLVLSRAYSKSAIKSKHYALVCFKNKKITGEKWQKINFANLKNIYSEKKKLGYSQVTAIVEPNGNELKNSLNYDVVFSAELKEPYFITLLNPLEVPKEEIKILDALLESKGLSQSDWKNWLLEFRKRESTTTFALPFSCQKSLPLKIAI